MLKFLILYIITIYILSHMKWSKKKLKSIYIYIYDDDDEIMAHNESNVNVYRVYLIKTDYISANLRNEFFTHLVCNDGKLCPEVGTQRLVL